MPGICSITKKRVLFGNNVSHSNRKTRRKFNINIQNVSLWSVSFKRFIRIKISASTIRTIDKYGGIDAFLLNTKTRKIYSKKILALKTVLHKRIDMVNNNG